eukprot:6212588-Pleurochrysis_carterae.AAC.3
MASGWKAARRRMATIIGVALPGGAGIASMLRQLGWQAMRENEQSSGHRSYLRIEARPCTCRCASLKTLSNSLTQTIVF